MNLIIERLNGVAYSFKEHGIKVLDFVAHSPSPRHELETIEGMDGAVDLGTTYGPRILSGSFMMKAKDNLDFPLLRNEIFKILDSREQFYLIDSREAGKRWRVKVSDSFSMEQIKRHGTFNFEFFSPFPYAESIGTTLDPKTFDAELWQVGQGLMVDETKYTHTTKTFRVYNAGDVTINPRKHPLVIEFKGSSLNLSIKNLTTGDEWKYTGSTAPLEVIKLDGVRSFKNDVSIFGDTNRKLITIQPGWNDFEITGPIGFDGFNISFSFRFLYI